MASEWSSDASADREKIDRARRNAEDLFKPKPQSRSAEVEVATENSAAPPEHQPQRQPRVFRISPVVPMGEAKRESPVKPSPMRQQQIVKRKAAVPPSQFGRVRALASYGMTQEQVAELYGVGVDVIERIVR